ncbi:hypothetical protein ACFP65_08310 [Marinilactibacillus sp. GCM10026970]|uniref:hypothetical protein n=1 Tax=Marinilactibacillus sp. GCM10026970 TaxID=3252642 RepID=UPI003606A15C
MDIKAFYQDLGEWVLSINQKSQSLGPTEYWEYILTTAGELSKKYNERPLIKKVIHAHIDYLEEAWKERTD